MFRLRIPSVFPLLRKTLVHYVITNEGQMQYKVHKGIVIPIAEILIWPIVKIWSL